MKIIRTLRNIFGLVRKAKRTADGITDVITKRRPGDIIPKPVKHFPLTLVHSA